jgi:hypothetical protein
MADTQLSATGTYGDGHEQAARDDAWSRRMLPEATTRASPMIVP